MLPLFPFPPHQPSSQKVTSLVYFPALAISVAQHTASSHPSVFLPLNLPRIPQGLMIFPQDLSCVPAALPGGLALVPASV